jgi:hypothetical protein
MCIHGRWADLWLVAGWFVRRETVVGGSGLGRRAIAHGGSSPRRRPPLAASSPAPLTSQFTRHAWLWRGLLQPLVSGGGCSSVLISLGRARRGRRANEAPGFVTGTLLVKARERRELEARRPTLATQLPTATLAETRTRAGPSTHPTGTVRATRCSSFSPGRGTYPRMRPGSCWPGVKVFSSFSTRSSLASEICCHPRTGKSLSDWSKRCGTLLVCVRERKRKREK